MTTKQDKRRNNNQGKSSHIKSGQGNPIGGKESQKQDKKSQILPLPLLGIPEKQQTNSHNIHRGPGAEHFRPRVCCFSLWEPLGALLS